MPTIVDCPSCQRKLRVPDDLLGQQVKCPTCTTMFVATEPSPPPPEPAAMDTPAAPSNPAAPSPPAPPPPPADEPMVFSCPTCGGQVGPDDTRCPSCRQLLSGTESSEGPGGPRWSDHEPHRGSMILTFGIISVVLSALGFCPYTFGVFSLIGLGLGIPAIVMGKNDLKRMAHGEMDPAGQGSTQAGWVCGIVGTVLAGMALLFCVAGVIFFVAIQAGAGGGGF